MPLFDFVVSHPSEWPTEIKDLACLLDSPIPSQLVNGSCPAVSSRASPLLEELRDSLTRSSEHPTESDSEILYILDLVLSTVGTLRALSNASNNDTMQPTIPFWSLLIRSLAFVCYDKSFITQEAAFVRPRLSYVRSFMEDGHASLLISHIVEDIQRPRSVVNDEASGHLSMMTAEPSNRESQEESDSETSYDDESSSETSYEHTEVSTDPTSAQSSYIPLDAHILASWRHPNSVVLPFLCVTDEEDIFSLMGGVLYQRSTWGISEPAIGIILSKTGFVGRVVLGWLDKVCPDPEVLPAIRFAYGDETRTDASLGVYDLTDPVSTVKFSQFILGLRAHVEGIVAQCQTPTFKRLSWRSDSIDDDNSGTEEQWEQGIVNWLNTVAKCRAPSESSSSHSCSFPMADSKKRATRSSSKSRPARRSMSADSKREPPPVEPAAQFVSDIDLVYPQEPSLGAARSKNLSDGASNQSVERGRQETRTDDGSSQIGKAGKRAKSADALSCSALGAKSLAGIAPDAKLSFSTYAHERHITGLTNVQFKVNTKELEDSKTTASEIEELENIAVEINEMLGFYEEMTQYMKPPIAKHGLPAVDKRVEAVREHFRSQVDALPAGPNTRELPQEFWEIISGSLSSLLWASVGGYSKNQGGKDHNEAEARHEWDILLNLGFVNTHELASGRVVLERALSLSRNVAADLAKSFALFNGKRFQAVADQAYRISRLVEQALDRRPSSSPMERKLVLQAIEVTGTALQNKFDVLDLFEKLEEAKAATLKRDGDEPELGIVDAILTIPLDNLQNTSESLVRVTETRQTVDAARTLNPADIADPESDKVSVDEPSSKTKGRAKKHSSSGPRSKKSSSSGPRSRPASLRSKSVSSRMFAIKEEQEAASQALLDDEAKRLDDANGTPKTKKGSLMHPFAVTCSEAKLAPKINYPTGMVMDVKELLTKLLLAVLVAEYKKPTQTYAKALVQAKMYLEASVRYLASLGVTKQGVFALATDGVEGAILMAWCSSDSERVYIVERNVRTFNISSPIEVYHFVTVLLRLREYGDTTLKDAVEAALKVKDFKQSSWSKTAQFNRME
ncbi:hypothetical protein EV421DRAFT_1900382 [Armillaria borealis]|uniref:Uncharacterized protein n=1 Tax=Armillaria borealis TaxID=47425 RepID=A0AA39JTJ9_9AGAR|nr:hypothetical protein EV421DRAFT_1900382 [Armillaria borealis]